MLIKARKEYRTLVTNKTWTEHVHHKDTQHRNDRRKQRPTNIAALVASTSQDNEITKLKLELKNTKKPNLALRKNGKQPNNPTKAVSSKKYSWNLQWGENKEFQLREEFFTCLYTTHLDRKSKLRRNG